MIAEVALDDTVLQPAKCGTTPARLLGVGGDPSLFRELARYVEQSGATLERTADEATTLQALAHGGWDAVLTVLDRDADVQLEWWEEVLPRLAVRPRMIAVERNRPRTPPATLSTSDSIRSCRMSCHFDAPTASLTATSFCRATARAISRFATLKHAISSTSPTMHISTISAVE